MLSAANRFSQLDDLRQFVNEILCEREQLEIDAFPIYERVLQRGGRPCGLMFSLHGPRAVTVSAIWDTDRDLILFYDSTGQRFRRTQLLESPRDELLAVSCQFALTSP
jgi:hypothetical protein